MAIKHKKVSGAPNVDSQHIGGGDWDDNHLYTAGAPFVAGRFSAFFDGSTLAKNQSSSFFYFNKTQDGGYKLLVDRDQLPVPIGATVRFSGVASIFPLPLPAGWSFDCYAEDGAIDFQFLYNNDPADPGFTWRVEGALFAEVV